MSLEHWDLSSDKPKDYLWDDHYYEEHNDWYQPKRLIILVLVIVHHWASNDCCLGYDNQKVPRGLVDQLKPLQDEGSPFHSLETAVDKEAKEGDEGDCQEDQKAEDIMEIRV